MGPDTFAATNDCPYCDGVGMLAAHQRPMTAMETAHLIVLPLDERDAVAKRSGSRYFAQPTGAPVPCVHCWGTGKDVPGKLLEDWITALLGDVEYVKSVSTITELQLRNALTNVRDYTDLGHCGVMWRAPFVLRLYNVLVGLRYRVIDQLKNSGGTP